MRQLLHLELLLYVLVLAGCSPVLIGEPIGQQVEVDQKQLDLIEGRWQSGDSFFEVRHLDGSRFEITEIEDDPENGEEEPKAVIVTQTDKEHTYFHIEQIDEATGEKGYMLLRLGIVSGRKSELISEVVLYMANVRSFAKAVESGKLKGIIKRNDDNDPTSVKLTSPSAEIERWLDAQENEPFVIQQVFVARKVK